MINTYCYSLQQVYIEFLYYDRFCQYCPESAEDYIRYRHNLEILTNIQRDYGEKIVVKYIFFFSEEGLEKVKQYNLSLKDWNIIVVNGKIILGRDEKYVNETLLREIIDSQLAGLNQNDQMEYIGAGIIATAFILGFFESFSPCVLIMLSFIVGYTSSDEDKSRTKGGFLKVMSFGASFIFASAIFSWMSNLFFSSAPFLRSYLTLVICFLAIIFGFNLVGLLKFPEPSKFFIRKAARKYAFGYIKIFLLGLMFYFLDPCIAPIFASMVTILFSEAFSFALFFFCIGVMVPFIVAGLFVGSISKISRGAYIHRTILRSISGIILMGYASYLLFQLITYNIIRF